MSTETESAASDKALEIALTDDAALMRLPEVGFECVCTVGVLHAINCFTDTDSTRYALGAVQVRSLGTDIWLAASEGHIACRYRLVDKNDGVSRSILIPGRLIRQIPASKKHRKMICRVSVPNNSQVVLEVAGVKYTDYMCQARFPRTSDLYQDAKKCCKPGLDNQRYSMYSNLTIPRIWKCAEMLDAPAESVQVYSDRLGSMAYWTIPDHDIAGLLMPVTHDLNRIAPHVPSWAMQD